MPTAAGVPAIPAFAVAISASSASRAFSASATVIALLMGLLLRLPSMRIASAPRSTVSWATKKVTMARKKNSRTGLT